MFLDRLETIVNRLSHLDGEYRQEDRRNERQQRQLDVDAQHEVQREQAAEDCVREIHHCGAEGHPHGAQIIGEARHNVAGACMCKVRGVERL